MTAYNITGTTRELNAPANDAVAQLRAMRRSIKPGRVGMRKGRRGWGGIDGGGGRAQTQSPEGVRSKKEEFPGIMVKHAAWELLSPDLRCF